FDYTANAGVREVNLQTESYDVKGDHADTDYTKALPSASLNLSLDATKKLRVGVARAISRPPLDELRAGSYLSNLAANQGGSSGNPKLLPFTSDQLDVSYEWYFAPESLAALAVYYKNVDNYVGYSTIGTFLSSTGDSSYVLTGPTNGKGGYVRGLEATFQMPFNFLPVEGFGIYSNYAYAQSDIKEFTPTDDPLPMVGLAKDTAALDLWYSKNGFDARIGWKYHSAYTTGFEWDAGALGTLDPELNVGFSASYDINEHWNVRFQAYNLTNEPLRLTRNNNSTDLKRYDDYGRSYLLDFTWKL
ncbi:MAG TPA: TonB-dependent receptor, partial [Cellvibrio sp.]